ncbi:MAG: GxxExxY protein [Bacteroidetes bacterium]|nr:GxxExxY protein [Bacteroidota bacterium]
MFEVSNELGGNMLEKLYQKAIASILKREGINFKEEVEVKLNFGDKVIANGYLDFLIEDKIILEIKRGDRFMKTNIDQLNSYLKMTNLQLGILVNFTSKGLLFKRIVNIQSKEHS